MAGIYMCIYCMYAYRHVYILYVHGIQDQEAAGVEYSIPEVMMVVEPRVEAQKNPAYGTTTLETQKNLAYGITNITAHDSGVQYNDEYIQSQQNTFW